jgi:hypothetical protein
MPPAVALLGVGPGSWWVPFPIPLILLWPVFFLALAALGLTESVTSGGPFPRTQTLWLASRHLRGVKVDLQSATGTRVFLWIV